MIIETILGTLV